MKKLEKIFLVCISIHLPLSAFGLLSGLSEGNFFTLSLHLSLSPPWSKGIYVLVWLGIFVVQTISLIGFLALDTVESLRKVKLKRGDVDTLRSFLRRVESENVIAINLDGKSMEFIREGD